MSSPRGFVDGGILAMIGLRRGPANGEVGGVRRMPCCALIGGGDPGGVIGLVLEPAEWDEAEENQPKGNFEGNGCVRTFKYILNDLSALLACGTYLEQS